MVESTGGAGEGGNDAGRSEEPSGGGVSGPDQARDSMNEARSEASQAQETRDTMSGAGDVLDDVAGQVGGDNDRPGPGAGSMDAAQASAMGGGNDNDNDRPGPGAGSIDAAQASAMGRGDRPGAGEGSIDAAQASAMEDDETREARASQERMEAEAKAARDSFERRAQAQQVTEQLEVRETVSQMIDQHSAQYGAGLLGTVPATEYFEDDLAAEVMSIARTDPARASELAAELIDQLPATEAELVDTMLRDRIETARQAEFTLDTRARGTGEQTVEMEQVRNAADTLIADSYSVSIIGGMFGMDPSLDTDALAEGLLEMREANPDLAVATRRDIVSRVTPEQAEALDAVLAEAPFAPGAAVAMPTPDNFFRDTFVGRLASGMVGDTLALGNQLVREDGLPVNPLSGELLHGGALQDAKVMALFDFASLGMSGRFVAGTRTVDEVVETGARALDEAAPVVDDVAETAADVLARMAGQTDEAVPTTRAVVDEVQNILGSAGLEAIKDAHAAGRTVTVEIGGRTIQYEPGLPASGMTMFGDDGFLLGPEAFRDAEELTKTMLHELHRLNTSNADGGVFGDLAAQETEAAFEFAERAFEEFFQ